MTSRPLPGRSRFDTGGDVDRLGHGVQVSGSVNVLVTDRDAMVGGMDDQTLGHLGRNCLAALVERHVALRHAQRPAKFGLGLTQPVTDDLDAVHTLNRSFTSTNVQQFSFFVDSSSTANVEE